MLIHLPGKALPGNTLVEYGLLLSLVAVLCLAALQGLGTSSSQLLENIALEVATPMNLNIGKTWFSDKQAIATSAPPIISTLTTTNNLTGNTKTRSDGDYYKLVIDPQSGEPILELSNTAISASSNTSSIEGMLNTLGSLKIAATLAELARQETDPIKSDYFAQMAKLTYYLGGAEGEIDDVKTLDLPNYTNGNALKDILSYQESLQKLMLKPPMRLKGSESLSMGLALAADANNIAQKYTETFKQYIGPNGQVSDFNYLPNHIDTGTGYKQTTDDPGSAFAKAESGLVASSQHVYPVTYEQLVDYKTMQSKADAYLSKTEVASIPVQYTFQNATGLNSHP